MLRGSAVEEGDSADDQYDGSDAGGGQAFAEEGDAEGEGEDGFEAEDEDVNRAHFGGAHGDGLATGSGGEKEQEQRRGPEPRHTLRVLHGEASEGEEEGRCGE